MSGIEKESGMRTQLIIVGLFLVVASCGGGGDDGPGMVDSAPATDVLDGRTAVPLDGRLQEVVGDVLIVPDGEGFDVTADTLADSQPDASVDLLADAHIDTFLDGGSELPEEVCDEFDEDCDGVPDDDDNCPALANLEQEDFDDDELGDVCDTDDDADGVEDVDDAFPLDPAEWSDVDGDGIGDNADAEECDGVDNDGDGLVDEELPVTWWYPDADGDGFGAGAGSSCASLFAEGAIEDGVYEIWPDSVDGPVLDVCCDMTTDGGGWTRVFYHDIADGYYSSDEEAHEINVEDPLGLRYSILSYLESFRSSGNAFVFRINWPNTGIPGRNIWRQQSNPTTGPVEGYEGLEIDYVAQYWGGLELSGDPTYLDGSVNHNNWFYSIGSQVPWNNPPGIPAYTPQSDRVALWVRPDDAAAGGSPVEQCGPFAGYADIAGDCDDTKAYAHPQAPEVCNGVDDNCDGFVDEECPYGDLAFSAMPQPLHFYARDLATDSCSFTIEGETLGVASEVLVAVTQDGQSVYEAIGEGSPFAMDVSIVSGLHLYEVAVAWDNGSGWWKPAAAVGDIVCGDVFLIDGQSNAVATDYHNEHLADATKNTFVRSFGSSVNNSSVTGDVSFVVAVAETAYIQGSIGQWGLRLANVVMETQSMPVLFINGAVGGTKVAQHQRNDGNPEDLSTIYGRLLWRVNQAKVADSIRAIFWHQGESDGNMAYDTYLGLWTAMYEDWLEDYPNVEGIYPFQVRAGCGNPTWNRNVHRDLPFFLPLVSGHMSTTGVDGHDGCHFYHQTYVEWGDRMARLVNRHLYGTEVPDNIEAPDPVKAEWVAPGQVEIDYGDTGVGLVLQPGSMAYFSLSDGAVIVDASVIGNTVVLTTGSPSTATWVSLVDVAGDIPWLVNDLGIGSFAYYQLPVVP